MAEQRRSRDLSEEQLVDAEVEADVMDADLEEYAESPAVGAREMAPSRLSEDERAEAEAESDRGEGDSEGS
jgi:hypothetical protein